jgi:hypothetical protein
MAWTLQRESFEKRPLTDHRRYAEQLTTEKSTAKRRYGKTHLHHKSSKEDETSQTVFEPFATSQKLAQSKITHSELTSPAKVVQTLPESLLVKIQHSSDYSDSSPIQGTLINDALHEEQDRVIEHYQ